MTEALISIPFPTVREDGSIPDPDEKNDERATWAAMAAPAIDRAATRAPTTAKTLKPRSLFIFYLLRTACF